MESPSYYAIIPASVRYDKSLCPNAKLLYGEITALSSKEGYCWASNSYLANLYDVEQTTVSAWIKQLSELGFIRSELENNSKRKLFITDLTLRKIPKPPSENPEAPPSENPEAIITSTITTSTAKENPVMDFGILCTGTRVEKDLALESWKIHCSGVVEHFEEWWNNRQRRGWKDAADQFVISWQHDQKFYYDKTKNSFNSQKQNGSHQQNIKRGLTNDEYLAIPKELRL